jgi:adenylate cyclase
VASLRLRALFARAHGDHATYSHLVNRYRTTATSLGFEGHIAMAATMEEAF